MRQVPAILCRPPRFPGTVERARLSALADRCPSGVALVAPSGSGKSVLAVQLAHGRRVAWARMAPGWGGAEDLVALASAAVGAEPQIDSPGLVGLAGALLSLLEKEPTVLVVDDYAHAIAEECDPLLAEVLALVPTGSAVVVCSRLRPAGLLGRARGLIDVVGPDQLAFTEAEAAALLADENAAADAVERTGGWATGVAVHVASSGSTFEEAVRFALKGGLSDTQRQVAAALALLPWLDARLAVDLGVCSADAFPSVVASLPLVSQVGEAWRLSDPARQAVIGEVDPLWSADLRRRAATALDAVDPLAAVELLIEAGAPAEAADALARHIGVVRPDQALAFLYRMPADVRRRLPPALAAGIATVDIDAATADARERLARASDAGERASASFGLGSALAHSGRLAEAAGTLEDSIGHGSPPTLAATASAWLGVVRWWAGDLPGARSALLTAGDGAFAWWARAEVDLGAGDASAASEAAATSIARAGEEEGASAAPARSVLARIALGGGRSDEAASLAALAYEEALSAGGFVVGAAVPVHGWIRALAGDAGAARGVADRLLHGAGRHDAFSQLHAALLLEAAARIEGDKATEADARRRVAQLRQGGFAPIEAQARMILDRGRSQPELEVLVLGPRRVLVDGREVGSWRSRKALDVLTYLALRGERGAGREEVAEAIWPGVDPDKGRGLLRTALAEVRRKLEPGRHAGEASAYLVTSGTHLIVKATTDLDAARKLATKGARAEALALFRGELVADDPYGDWVAEDRWEADALRARLEAG